MTCAWMVVGSCRVLFPRLPDVPSGVSVQFVEMINDPDKFWLVIDVCFRCRSTSEGIEVESVDLDDPKRTYI